MQIKYSLSEQDYLQLQLFIASKSSYTKSARRKSWFMVTGFLGLFAILSFFLAHKILVYYFLFFFILSIFFYPYYIQYRYLKHYKKFVSKTQYLKFDKEIEVEFTDEYIQAKDSFASSIIQYQSLQYITETRDYFFITLITNDIIGIPKHGIKNSELLKIFLEKKATILEIPYNTELDWKWK